MSPSTIALANEKVSIVVACQLAGVALPDDAGYGRSMKVRCPFGNLHSDGGKEAALRVYPDTNSAWCFACNCYLTPVKVLAQVRELDWATASALLLEHIGYRPLSLAEQFQALTEHQSRPDTAQLADALKTYCARVIPGWETRQFDAEESALLTRCLSLLDRVANDTDAGSWLDTTKQVMSQQFSGLHSCT